MIEEKIYFTPGDVVQLKLDVTNKPDKMIVHRVERSIIRNTNGKDYLRGVKVRWFTKDGLLQEAIFSTKDLILVEQ